MKKERFLFYVDWRNQMEMMNDEQLRRFIYNLCNYHEEKDVELPSELEKALWLGILPVLKLNNKKYEARAEKSRENGKLGGAPVGNQNARKDEMIQNNLNQPKQPDKSKEINDKGEEINDKSEMKKDNWQEKTGNSELISDKEEMSNFSNTSMYSGETFTNIENYSEDKNVKSVSGPDTGAEEIPIKILTDIFCNYHLYPPEYKNYVLTKNDYRRVLTAKVFMDFPDWENKLNELGKDKFIPTYARYLAWPLMKKRFIEFAEL